jgi:hypothetical protein
MDSKRVFIRRLSVCSFLLLADRKHTFFSLICRCFTIDSKACVWRDIRDKQSLIYFLYHSHSGKLLNINSLFLIISFSPTANPSRLLVEKETFCSTFKLMSFLFSCSARRIKSYRHPQFPPLSCACINKNNLNFRLSVVSSIQYH